MYICEICAPYAVRSRNGKVLIQQVLKYLVRFAFPVSGFASPANAVELKLLIHIFMYGSFAQVNPISLKKHLHTSVTEDAAKFVVNAFYFVTGVAFLNVIRILAMLEIVVIGVGMNPHPSQEPPQTECFTIGLDESISR